MVMKLGKLFQDKRSKDELYACFAKIIRRKLSKILDNEPDIIHAYILQDHKSI